MGKSTHKDWRSSLISDTARDSAKMYQQTNIKIRRQVEEDFFNQSVDYRDYIFSPEGYEGIVFSLYLLIIPYLVGLLFLFLFVAEASYEYFLAFNLSSFFIIWAIGYEVCAISILIGIFLAWFNHLKKRWDTEKTYKSRQNKHLGF